MIYLVGGPVRVGKSTLAKLVLHRQHISSITTDALTTSIGRNLPETRLAGRDISQGEWEENFYPFLRRFIKTIQFDYDDFLIEGAVISPAMAARLSVKFPIQAVFVGNTTQSVDNLTEHMGNNLWIRDATHQELADIPGQIIKRSRELHTLCQHYGYPFIDLADDFERQLEVAYQRLFPSES